MSKITLKGITWDHTRGYVPMVATSQRYTELHPEVEIVWFKRSLQEFADYPLQKLAANYDLLIIDHPFVGYVASHTVLLPLDEHLPADYLNDQAANAVGLSYESYWYGGHLWALAIDAATPVSSYRPDLFMKHKLSLPRTWDELIELAKSGMVILPAIPIDSLMNFYYLCVSRGVNIFDGETLVDKAVGIEALEQLRQLVQLCPPECFERNPIKTYDALAAGDRYAYCPFAYGYNNYGRRGYAEKTLRFGDVLSLEGDKIGRTTLGGTGLAISIHCENRETALKYIQYVTSSSIQRTLYVDSGGQPGHRSAWLDDAPNERCNNFFRDTLQTHDNAYLRPRYDGYLHFQDHGGLVLHDYLRNGGSPEHTLARLQALYEVSLKGTDSLAEGL